jgi:DNA-binding CsgD family transcriptional regulator
MLWRFQPQYEWHFAKGVVSDPRYQALLDELGIGQRWKTHLWERARELTAVTGIPVTSPRPVRPTPSGAARPAASALDFLPYAVILLNERRQIDSTNLAADELLARRSGLKTIGASLSAEDPSAAAQLRSAIDAACSGARSEGLLVRCPRRLPRRALQAFVAPVAAVPTLRGEANVVAVVLVSDPDAVPLPAATTLQSLFDLTPTLARLAAAIVAGKTVKEFAEEHGVTEGTARGYLKDLLARVGVRRQAELVRVLLSGVAQLPIPAP